MESKLKKIKEEALKELKELKDSEALENFKNKYFGRKGGALSNVMKDLKDVSEDMRPKLGALANTVKKEIEERYEKQAKALTLKALELAEEKEWIDTTVSIDKYRVGHLHPMTQVMNELEDIFSEFGFIIEMGPEVESDYYNFEALNIPFWHPAREAQDTFYIKGYKGAGGDFGSRDIVLRTQTSPVQVRAMQKYGAPLRVVVPGKTFRNEATDASHDHTFYQLEGLMIDKEISIANLVAVMKEALSAIFKKDVDVRLRPGYFPFVEPGFEMDFKCLICNGKGCSVCKHTGWVEFLGAGLVHPNVLKYGGIDPKKYQGFAFGMGITRLAMMKFEIDDARLLHSSDLRFLNQF